MTSQKGFAYEIDFVMYFIYDEFDIRKRDIKKEKPSLIINRTFVKKNIMVKKKRSVFY